ncbi:MAG: putative multidrug resistance protein EmrK [Chlamydiales bacterium]|nr:putative multidrug resistance protein EmrK [Chlamydiales bacterium]MCH9635958.1 putative multidrug resistance protein EmrK [Chlamydiales bacterium]MCH9703240.1 efflux RND transporter periplasmic adaptor subunit [Chlamydiota bacterium]
MERKKLRLLSLCTLTLLFIGAGILWFCLWFFHWRFEISTDDAYVHGNIIPISSQMISPIVTIHVEESDFVHEGDLLVTLNDTDAKAQLESAKGALAAACRRFYELQKQKEAAFETLKIKQAQKHLAHYTYFHKSSLEGSGVLAGADIEGSEIGYEIAESELLIAKAQYEAVAAQIDGTTINTHPLVQEARGHLIAAFLNLKHTQIRAPATGYVAARAAQVGEIALPQKVLLNVIPLSTVWVEANYKEGQLRHMGLGQTVELYSDLYGKDVCFSGKVRGIAPGTGGVFSFLPPQNATGNWIKVVQRIPVIIDLDPDQIKEHPLLLGISMHATVHIDDDADILSQTNLPSFDLNTVIYKHEQAEAEDLVERIIEKNSPNGKKLLSLLIDRRF